MASRLRGCKSSAQVCRPVPSDIQRNSSIEKTVIEHIADHPAAILNTCRVGTLREKGTLFNNLMLSDNFKRILERSMTDPALQRKLEGLVDLD